METIIIQPKNKEEAEFLTELLLKLNITIAHEPNKETIEAIKEARQKKGKRFNKVSDLMNELNS